MDLRKELTIDMLPVEGWYKEIALKIGIDNLLLLTDILGGSTFYLPKTESFLRPVRDKHITEDFISGSELTEIAIRYNVSERWVRMLCTPSEKA